MGILSKQIFSISQQLRKGWVILLFSFCSIVWTCLSVIKKPYLKEAHLYEISFQTINRLKDGQILHHCTFPRQFLCCRLFSMIEVQYIAKMNENVARVSDVARQHYITMVLCFFQGQVTRKSFSELSPCCCQHLTDIDIVTLGNEREPPFFAIFSRL